MIATKQKVICIDKNGAYWQNCNLCNINDLLECDWKVVKMAACASSKNGTHCFVTLEKEVI